MEQKQMQLTIAPEVAQGKYSNLAIIAHTKTEFVVDFASNLPAQPNPIVTNRVILAPEHAKRLLMALKENVQKYEQQFGTINLQQAAPAGTYPLSFGNGEA